MHDLLKDENSIELVQEIERVAIKIIDSLDYDGPSPVVAAAMFYAGAVLALKLSVHFTDSERDRIRDVGGILRATHDGHMASVASLKNTRDKSIPDRN